MDVIAVCSDLQERDLVAVADVQADTPQNGLYLLGDDRPAVLGRTNGVVKQRRDIVPLVDKVAHTFTVYRTSARAASRQIR